MRVAWAHLKETEQWADEFGLNFPMAAWIYSFGILMPHPGNHCPPTGFFQVNVGIGRGVEPRGAVKEQEHINCEQDHIHLPPKTTHEWKKVGVGLFMALWPVPLWIMAVNKYCIQEVLISFPSEVPNDIRANRFIFPTQTGSANDKPWRSIALNDN